MGIKNKQQWFLLFIGDIVVFLVSLWLTLTIRYVEAPSIELWQSYLYPFGIIFAISVLFFFIAGLYEKPNQSFNTKLPITLLYAQVANTLFAVIFFYLFPFFGINPKTTLFVYVVVSTALLFIWRYFGRGFFELGSKNNIVLIGEKGEIEEIKNELEHNKRLRVNVVRVIDIDTTDEEEIGNVFTEAKREGIDSVVADSNNPKVASVLSKYYDFVLSNIILLDIHDLYEQIFDRVYRGSIDYSWLVQLNRRSLKLYDIVKRIIDLLISIPMAIIVFPFFPLVAIAIRLEGPGSIFITQERVGKKGQRISMYKFRSMKNNDRGVWLGEAENTNRVTKVGYFLRKSRIDELPQLVNVIRGDVSLIGPRPDIIGLGEKLMLEIPYYMTRYGVQPGLSGWAQIQQTLPPQSVDATKLRFAYDLYYVKNRSVLLDLKIALRTIKTLLARTGM